MIAVNSNRIKNPANIAKKKKQANQKALQNKKSQAKIGRILLLIILGGFLLFGGWYIGLFKSLGYGADSMWNNITKAIGVRLESVQLVGYEVRDQDDNILNGDDLSIPKDEILEALGLSNIEAGEYPLMALDPKRLRTQLEQLSWVQAAAVQRVLPNTIRIHIVPRSAFVMMQKGKDISMLDSFGNSLPMQKGDLERKLLRITGKGSFDASLELINILAEEPKLLDKIKLAERISERRWNIYLNNGLLVKMPEHDELKAWKKLAELSSQEDLFNRAVNLVDLRYEDHLVVRGDFLAEIPKNIKKGA
ncbi:MAG: cell division protein FtsQ/DivIB [Alphaproteobacteria bacterium]